MIALVCGATGTTGGEVLRQLRARGALPRAMTRGEEAARRFGDEGIDAVVADLAEPSTLTKALDQRPRGGDRLDDGATERVHAEHADPIDRRIADHAYLIPTDSVR